MTKPTTGRRIAPGNGRQDGSSARPVKPQPVKPEPVKGQPVENAEPAPAVSTRPTGEESVQMAGNALITSWWTGLFFVLATAVFGIFGGAMLKLGGRLGEVRGAQVGLAAGLALGLLLIALVLRRYADRLKARSRHMYHGMWIGTWFALGIIVVMTYFPQIAFPQYCPPGALCETQSAPVRSG